MRKIMTGFAFAAAVALCSGAFAADQPAIGKKLLIKNPGGTSGPNNKIVYLSKDITIAQPSGLTQDPRCAPNGTASSGSASAALTVTGSDSFSIPLVCDNWTVNGGGNLFKYKDTTGASCTIVLIKNNKLVKAICKGSQVSFDLGPSAETVVSVVLRSGPSNRYCSSYGVPAGCSVVKDGSDGKTYLAKNCAAAGVCGASPSGAFLETANLF